MAGRVMRPPVAHRDLDLTVGGQLRARPERAPSEARHVLAVELAPGHRVPDARGHDLERATIEDALDRPMPAERGRASEELGPAAGPFFHGLHGVLPDRPVLEQLELVDRKLRRMLARDLRHRAGHHVDPGAIPPVDPGGERLAIHRDDAQPGLDALAEQAFGAELLVQVVAAEVRLPHDRPHVGRPGRGRRPASSSSSRGTSTVRAQFGAARG